MSDKPLLSNNNNNENDILKNKKKSHDDNSETSINKEEKKKESNSFFSYFISNILLEKYLWYIALMVLLFALGKWQYDKYMEIYNIDTLEERYIQYLKERWSREGDALLTRVAADPSFTPYHMNHSYSHKYKYNNNNSNNKTIYFRAITRKIPLSPTAGSSTTSYNIKIGLAEVDDNNNWRGEEEENNNTNNNNNWHQLYHSLRCVTHTLRPIQFHSVGLLSNGIRFTSSYVSKSFPERRPVREHILCLQFIMPFMCVGDKWEIICPPEFGFGELGEREVPPRATTIWRISIEDISFERKENNNNNNNNQNNNNNNNRECTRAEAEALLAAAVLQTEGSPAMTRRKLFERSKQYLGNSNII